MTIPNTESSNTFFGRNCNETKARRSQQGLEYMPSGIYIRTKEHIKKLKERKYKAQQGFQKGHIGYKGMLGKHHTLKARKKIGLARLGKALSESTRRKLSLVNRGENSYAWRGDKCCYQRLHQWVKRWKGKPMKCEHCGTEEKKMYHWANKSHNYLRDLNDWISLCVPCHKQYDGYRGKLYNQNYR